MAFAAPVRSPCGEYGWAADAEPCVRSGASLNDPSRLFNSSLEGKVRRAIDIREDDEIDEGALKNLVREAVALNLDS